MKRVRVHFCSCPWEASLDHHTHTHTHSTHTQGIYPFFRCETGPGPCGLFVRADLRHCLRHRPRSAHLCKKPPRQAMHRTPPPQQDKDILGPKRRSTWWHFPRGRQCFFTLHWTTVNKSLCIFTPFIVRGGGITTGSNLGNHDTSITDYAIKEKREWLCTH